MAIIRSISNMIEDTAQVNPNLGALRPNGDASVEEDVPAEEVASNDVVSTEVQSTEEATPEVEVAPVDNAPLGETTQEAV